MKSSMLGAGRRSAREWSRLVAAWKKSGQSTAEFAASHGLVPRTLTWWKWRLARVPVPPASEPEAALRLVPLRVELEPTPTRADSSPAWEVATPSGRVLRVYREIAAVELSAVLAALVAGDDR